MNNLLAEMNVSGDLASLLLAYMDRQGLELPALRASLRQFRPASRMRFRHWWHYLETLQRQLPEQPVGMELGQAIAPSHLGVLGYLSLSCATVAEALQRFQRYQRLLHDGDTGCLELAPEGIRLYWENRFGPSTQLSDEVLVMGMVTHLRRLTGIPNLQPLSLNFTGAPAVAAAAYRQFVQCPVYFNQPQLDLRLPADCLNLPLGHGDPALRQLLEQQAQTLLAVLPKAGDFELRLRQAIVKAIEDGQPNLDQVARTLALSRRTLHRRLQDRGLEFRALLQSARLQLARQYLQQRRLTLTEIALLLGYSEQSAFSRAFRHWSGESPRQYQRRSREQGSG